jgi:FAD/FMN-containing dehydrogenase
MMVNQIVKKLKNIVGAEWVRTDILTRYHYSNDVVTHISSGKMYAPNPPLVIVFPRSTKDIQSILKLASKNNSPLYAIGGGTVLLIGSVPGKPNIGITLDFHRMQKVEVDQERMVVKVQPGATGIQVSQLVREMGFGYRPFFGGSPGSSHYVPYQLFTGQNKMAGYQDGMGINCATGMEMVLASGEIVCSGSMADPDTPAWPHGPGPALTFLPFYANAGYGIVAEMEFRLFPTPKVVASLWTTFDNLESAVEGMYKIMHQEYACGAAVLGHGCWTHCLYSARHWQEGVHFIKATQNMTVVGLSFRGSQDKVDYERKACIKTLKKYGGTPMPDWLVAILDGHEKNTEGWQQANSPRVLGSFNGKSDTGGLFVTGGVFDTLEKLKEHMDQGRRDYLNLCKEFPEFVNSPSPSFRLYTSCGQTYLSMGGHSNAAGEFIIVVDYAHPEQMEMVSRLVGKYNKTMNELGLAPLSIGRDMRTWTECPAHFEMAKILKEVVDPQKIMAPGASFPG